MGFFKISLLLVWQSLIISQIQSTPNLVNVDTDCGEVEGRRFDRVATTFGRKKSIYEFRNIPYAEPPVGNLRWRPTRRLSEDQSKCWNGTLQYDETKLVACNQVNPNFPTLETTEDCLVLTVRTPTLNRNAKLPVLFWIHGGGLLWGWNESPAYFPDREFTATMNAVTVSINYRLNLFGFMSLQELWITSGPDESYGNYGLMDMIAALKWTRDNIQNFGGDPNKVTIFGESGGGTAVYGLIASPLAQGLFQKASALSGAPNFRVTHPVANQINRKLLAQFPCLPLPTDQEVAACFRSLSTNVLLAPILASLSNTEATESSLLTYHFQFPRNEPYVGLAVEILDPVVVPFSPDQIPLTRGDSIDLLIGSEAQEVAPISNSPPYFERNVTDFQSLRNEVEPRLDTFRQGVFSLALALYTKLDDGSIAVPIQKRTARYVYELMATDAQVSCTTNNIVDFFSRFPRNNVFRYVVSQPPSSQIASQVMGTVAAFHGWGTDVLFGLRKVRKGDLTFADKRLVANMQRVYFRFIHSDAWFRLCFRNRAIDFFNNKVRNIGPTYHREQCKAWDLIGVLNNSWGNLGGIQ